ncbi:hypothetical protein MKZ38_010494 [Zalerion maritima]|uniref:Uncharacterized protein n=1 Tax=Zalerion maritima TaxID=339359 RepID=A0AAD5WSG6_9PEZI|nr:hypothetical protein MKZ38_010494 [Zalerion maritima]
MKATTDVGLCPKNAFARTSCGARDVRQNEDRYFTPTSQKGYSTQTSYPAMDPRPWILSHDSLEDMVENGGDGRRPPAPDPHAWGRQYLNRPIIFNSLSTDERYGAGGADGVPLNLMVDEPEWEELGPRTYVKYIPRFTHPNFNDKNSTSLGPTGQPGVQRTPWNMLLGIRPAILPQDSVKNPTEYARRFGIFPGRMDGRSLMSPVRSRADLGDILRMNTNQIRDARDCLVGEARDRETRGDSSGLGLSDLKSHFAEIDEHLFNLSWQQLRLGGLTTREVIDYGIWNPWDNSVGFDLNNETNPLLAREKWEDASWRGGHPDYPKFFYNIAGHRGHWDARNNDLVWNALQAPIKMVTQFLKSPSPIFDAMLDFYCYDKLDEEVDTRRPHELTDPSRSHFVWMVRRNRPPREEMLPSLRSAFDEGLPFRQWVEEILSDRIVWGIRSDSLYDEGSEDIYSSGVTYQPTAVIPKIRVYLSADTMWPLLHPGFTTAEKASASTLIATTILHELCHAIVNAWKCLFRGEEFLKYFDTPVRRHIGTLISTDLVPPPNARYEPFLENVSWAEAGGLMEGETWGGSVKDGYNSVVKETGILPHFKLQGMLRVFIESLSYPHFDPSNPNLANYRPGYVRQFDFVFQMVPYAWAARFCRQEFFEAATQKYGHYIYKAMGPLPFIPTGVAGLVNPVGLFTLVDTDWSRAVLTALSRGHYYCTYMWIAVLVQEGEQARFLDSMWLGMACTWPDGIGTELNTDFAAGLKAAQACLRAILTHVTYMKLPRLSRRMVFQSVSKALLPFAPDHAPLGTGRGKGISLAQYPMGIEEALKDYDIHQQSEFQGLLGHIIPLLMETERYFVRLANIFSTIVGDYLRLDPDDRADMHHGQLDDGSEPTSQNRGIKFWLQMMEGAHFALTQFMSLHGAIGLAIPEVDEFFGPARLPETLQTIGICAQAASPHSIGITVDSLSTNKWLSEHLPRVPSGHRRKRSDLWKSLALREMRTMVPDARDKMRWFFKVNVDILDAAGGQIPEELDAPNPNAGLVGMMGTAFRDIGKDRQPLESKVADTIFGRVVLTEDMPQSRKRSRSMLQRGQEHDAGMALRNILTDEDLKSEHFFQNHVSLKGEEMNVFQPHTMKPDNPQRIKMMDRLGAQNDRQGQKPIANPREMMQGVLEDDGEFITKMRMGVETALKPPDGARSDQDWARDVADDEFDNDNPNGSNRKCLLQVMGSFEGLWNKPVEYEPPPALRPLTNGQASEFVVPKKYEYRMEKGKKERMQESLLRMQYSHNEGFANIPPPPKSSATAHEWWVKLCTRKPLPQEQVIPEGEMGVLHDPIGAGYASGVKFGTGEQRANSEWNIAPFGTVQTTKRITTGDLRHKGVEVTDRVENMLTPASYFEEKFPRDMPPERQMDNGIGIDKRYGNNLPRE